MIARAMDCSIVEVPSSTSSIRNAAPSAFASAILDELVIDEIVQCGP